MKSVLTAAIIGAALCISALAQDASPSAADPRASQAQPGTQQAAAQMQAANSIKIAPGSVISVQLSKTIDAKKAATGDEVVATVTQDMKSSSGEVLVPKNTKVIGHVTEAQARNKEQKQSEVGIAFDHVLVKGDPVQIPMSIQAIIAEESSAPRSADSPSPDMTGTTRTSPMSGRSGTMAGSDAPAPRAFPPGGAPDSSPQAGARPAINGNTQGVIGMPDVKLETSAQNAAQGSVLTSEKNNVKIEKGTLMLLRVSR